MTFAERQLPGDGTLAAVFTCSGCGHEMAMLTNPMETQLVSSLGVKIGGRAVPEQPLELTRNGLAESRAMVFVEKPSIAAAVTWNDEATERLERVPAFVRGMVKRIYADYARDHGIAMITPAIMDQARTDLGLEGM
ncbi:MAG: PCP reductase family protein [Gemmatimonadota bacterium]